MKQYSIRTKLLACVGALAGGYLVFFFLIQWSAGRTQEHLTRVSKAIYPATLRINQANDSFQAMNKDYKDAVLLQDQKALDAADKDASIVRENLEAARTRLEKIPELQKQVADVLDSFVDLQGASKRTYSAMVSSTDNSGQSQDSLSGLADKNRKINQAFADLANAIGDKAFQSELDAITDFNAWQRWLAIVLLGGAIGLAALTMFVMERQVSTPLRQLTEKLSSGAVRVADSARLVSQSSASLASGASTQAASLEETSASAQEINSMASRTSNDCRSAHSIMEASQTRFAATNESLAQLVLAMDEIQKSNNEVSNIIKAIDEIAFKTNILALNAAVEAARAGEAGAGFAVVAEEVRNLAGRCAQAVKESSVIVDQSTQNSQQGKTRLDTVVEALGVVTADSGHVKALMDQITSATAEQTRGIDQISRAMSEMERLTQTSASSADQSASAAEELKTQSNLLNEVVSSLTAMVEGGSGHNGSTHFQHTPAVDMNAFAMR